MHSKTMKSKFICIMVPTSQGHSHTQSDYNMWLQANIFQVNKVLKWNRICERKRAECSHTKNSHFFLFCYAGVTRIFSCLYIFCVVQKNIALLLCVFVSYFVYTFSESRSLQHNANRACENAKKTKVAQSLKANAFAIVSTFLPDCCNISQIKILTWRNQNSGALVQVKNGRSHYTSLNARSECVGFSPTIISWKKK